MSDTKRSIGIIDYGMGNIRSIRNAVEVVGAEPTVIETPEDLGTETGIIVPGVGAFADGIRTLRDRGFVEALEERVQDDGVPYLGLCLGMQFLASESHENGQHTGLGWIPGTVERLQPEGSDFTVPHMGWNDVSTSADSTLYGGFPEDPSFYFVHSYHLNPDTDDVVTGTSWHGQLITASVRKDNVFGVQYHPEKSQGTGLRLLENFTTYVEREGE